MKIPTEEIRIQQGGESYHRKQRDFFKRRSGGGAEHGAVSYTHLDVYKRQRRGYCGRKHSTALPADGKETGRGGRTVFHAAPYFFRGDVLAGPVTAVYWIRRAAALAGNEKTGNAVGTILTAFLLPFILIIVCLLSLIHI